MWYEYVGGGLGVVSGGIMAGAGITCLAYTLDEWRTFSSLSGLIFSVALVALGGMLLLAGVEIWP